MDKEILTVSEFNSVLNQTLAFAYPLIWVEGEVSGFKISQNKWVFFDLKDSESTIGCFLSIYQLKTELEDGMKIRVLCKPNLTKWGKFSLTVQEIELAGEGSVKKAYELLYKKLDSEGLFALTRKRELPKYPKKVALITSSGTAAIADFSAIINKRWAGLSVDHLQVQVQGKEAESQIVSAIDYCNEHVSNYDALIIIRGGGSLEDLQVFNTEAVARAVFGSLVPVLSGVGHESDTSLCDLVADARAATPTDAARILTPNKESIASELDANIDHLQTLLTGRIAKLRNYLEALQNRHLHILAISKNTVGSLYSRAEVSIDRILAAAKTDLSLHIKLINSLSPQKILNRGYGLISVSGVVQTNPSTIKTTDKLMIQLAKGKFTARKIK